MSTDDPGAITAGLIRRNLEECKKPPPHPSAQGTCSSPSQLPALDTLSTSPRSRASSARVLAVTTSVASPIAGVADAVLDPVACHRTEYHSIWGLLFEQSVLVVGDALCRKLVEERALSFGDLDGRHANLQ